MTHNVGRKYKLSRELGRGSFGKVYLASDIFTGEEVAVKLEKTSSKNPQLKYESRVYIALEGGVGVPKLRWFGQEGNYNVLVMDKLGKSLEDLFEAANHKFDDLTTLLVGEQMLDRIEFMHSKNFIHRDIKPDNFLTGVGNESSLIYIIDFGLSKRYRNPRTGMHIPFIEGKSLTGTPRYASISNHMGYEQSRRDDLESIAYVLIYLSRGDLPWMGLPAQTKEEKYKRIMDTKVDFDVDRLCEKSPRCLKELLVRVRAMSYEEKPNYDFFKQIFRDCIQEFFPQGPHLPQWARGQSQVIG